MQHGGPATCNTTSPLLFSNVIRARVVWSHDGGENDGHDRCNDNDENGDLKSYAENCNPLTHPRDLSSCTHDTSLTRQYESEATIALEFVTVKPNRLPESSQSICLPYCHGKKQWNALVTNIVVIQIVA